MNDRCPHADRLDAAARDLAAHNPGRSEWAWRQILNGAISPPEHLPDYRPLAGNDRLTCAICGEAWPCKRAYLPAESAPSDGEST